MTRRVVITGMGTVNALSLDIGEFWRALLEGRSGVGRIEQFDTSAFKVHIAGEVKSYQAEAHFGKKDARRLDRFTQFALVAARAAAKDCGFDIAREDPYRCGVIVGSGIGGLAEFEEQHQAYMGGGPGKINPFVIPKMIVNAASGNVSIELGLQGPNTTVATACASAANAVSDAYDSICNDRADVMFTGGTESAITPMGLGGFVAARALSTRNDEPTRASRPFDKDRDGFVMAEGSGILVLEELEHARNRGASIYAEVLGCGHTADAYHITAPRTCGSGAARAMELALRYARVNREQIGYVNAHGTSTELGDVAETKAIKLVFGDHAQQLLVSSTKSMLGHLLGASGGVELMATALALKHGVIHPTINLDHPDPECDLDYIPNVARERRLTHAISNSFGFGGHNSCVVLGAFR